MIGASNKSFDYTSSFSLLLSSAVIESGAKAVCFPLSDIPAHSSLVDLAIFTLH